MQPKISANFEGLDTPEQFAAALYDYMAELEAAGMLQHPYSLDPREQAIVEIMEELRRAILPTSVIRWTV